MFSYPSVQAAARTSLSLPISRVASAILVVTAALAPSLAQAQSVPWTAKDAYHEESTESAECMAYYVVSGQCATDSGRPDMAQQLGQASDSARNLWVLLGQASGTSKDAMLAFLQMALAKQEQSIDKSCMNVAVIVQKYGDFCKALLEHPDARLKVLLAGPPPNDTP
jgi:hypothetical protein